MGWFQSLSKGVGEEMKAYGIPYIHAAQYQNGIRLASQREVDEIKRDYAWWYEVSADCIRPLLRYADKSDINLRTCA